MFGDRLKELRKKNNISQEEIGKMCGVAKNTISYWENNNTQPPFEAVKQISKYFGVTTDYLLGIDYNEVERLRIALKEAGIMKNDNDLTKDELEKALKIVEMMKENKDTND